MAAAEKICEVIGDVSRPKDPKDTDGGSFLCLKILSICLYPCVVVVWFLWRMIRKFG